MSKFYVTTPIYYVNDVPHIGHAYTTIAADVLSRYYGEKNGQEKVFFLTGTDEHGAKIAEAAKKAGKKPQDFVNELAPIFKSTWDGLGIKYSEFFRTTNPEHEKIVQDFVRKIQNAGYIEKRKYEGLYCVGCERYYKKEELVEGKCPDHKVEPVFQSEENYFFLLSKVAEDKKLYEKIESDEICVRPLSRKNEVLGKIKAGLEDVSISRAAVEWGIEYPGDSSQTIYVWVDALINYYSAAKIYKNGPDWPADLHLMAKDILWFHAVIWPSMLLAVDEKTPKQIFAHGFFTIDGQKMSKSVGNVLDPNKLVEKYGADAVRYALLREFPFGEDGDISEEKIATRYGSDLANGLGNLLQRTISMINKYEVSIENVSKIEIESEKESHIKECSKNIELLNFQEVLSDIWSFYVKPSNQLIDEKKPWELAKTDKNELIGVLGYAYRNLLTISEVLYPFMPETSEKMKNQLKTLKPEPLFPRIEDK